MYIYMYIYRDSIYIYIYIYIYICIYICNSSLCNSHLKLLENLVLQIFLLSILEDRACPLSPFERVCLSKGDKYDLPTRI